MAEIETICTHSDYRRKGLAEAVIKECMKRLDKLGIKKVYITAWNDITNNLYEKIGPDSRTGWIEFEQSGK